MAIALKTTSASSDSATRLQTTRLAAEPIVAFNPVALSSATEVVNSNTSSRARATVMGVALNSANVGEVVTILIYGYLSDPAISFPLNVPQIYRFSKYKSNFQEIDYTILNFFPKRFFTQGELRKVEWYSDQECTDMVLVVEIVYMRDSLGFALTRETTRTWVNNDNSLNPVTKVTVKDYTLNQGESSKEGKRRRGTLVDNLESPILNAMHEVLIPKGWTSIDILMNGRQFLDDYEWEFNKFINNSSTVTNKNDPNYGRKKVVVALETEADPAYTVWMDETAFSLDGRTPREYMIEEFSI